MSARPSVRLFLLTGTQTPLASTQTLLAGLQTPTASEPFGRPMDGRTDGRTDGWIDRRNFSPFYRTSSPLGAAALLPSETS